MGYWNKLAAVVQIKWLCISRNTVIMVGPVLVLAMVWGCKILYGMNADGEIPPVLVGFLLNLGIMMNICTDGFIMVGTEIAEEKEKHTLRVLMTSSVTGMQYFIGSILFPFVLLMGINVAVLYLIGIPMEQISMPVFLLVSAVASMISCVIGMIVGICAKNQMNANLISSPFMIVLMMVPLFGNLSDGIQKVSEFLFTGVLARMADCFAQGRNYVMRPLDLAVLFGELALAVLVFLMLYQKNGYEKD